MTEDISRIQQAQIHARQLANDAALEELMQVESEENFEQWTDEAFNPAGIARQFKQLELQTRRHSRKENADKAEKSEEEHLQVTRLEEVSEQFERKNPELQSRSLLLLRSRIGQNDTKEEILRKVLEMYTDHSLADEAIDFLIETTRGELGNQVRLAKETLNETHGREVRAGRNIAQQAREFSKEGLELLWA